MIYRLNIELFGHLAVRHGEERATHYRTQKPACLLAYLAYHLHSAHPREELIDLFWPSVDMEAGRTSLRTALASLRRQIEPTNAPENSIIVADRQNVRLNPETVSTDVGNFEAALQWARRSETAEQKVQALSDVVKLYRGPLLPGFYDDWVLRERTRFEQAFSDSLRELVDALEVLHDFDQAMQMAQRWVTVDPLAEAAHITLMRLYAVMGQSASAQRQFREWERLADAELGERPSPQARALLHQILENAPAIAAPSRAIAPMVPTPAPPQAAAIRSTNSDVEPFPSNFHPSRLPLQLTRFFGREQELAQVQTLLRARETRLLTLSGMGGTGKTRLALEVAQRLAPEWNGAVWFVPLADITEAERLPDTIAKAMCLRLSADTDALEQIVEALSPRPILLVLDNFEQMPNEAAEIVQQLLTRLPDLACLVTSRHRLGIGGEQEFPIAPLPTPAARPEEKEISSDASSDLGPYFGKQASSYPASLLSFPSVQMFVDRARQSRPDFQLTAGNAEIVATLCRQLEGIPLAIELTAAWVQTLTPAQMLERLNRRFDLLTSRRKDLPPRHRTLRATVEWSYRLLSPELQQFFARLCVFRGGWTLEAAEAICQTGEETASDREETSSILLPLSLLSERSLIIVEESREGMRYRLLETLREYGQEQLSEAGRHEVQARHRDHFLELAEAAERYLFGAEQVRWMDRLEQEHDNLRAALRFCQREGNRDAGLRLTGALAEFWHRRSYAREGLQWLETFVAQSADVPLPVLAKALLSYGILQNLFGPPERVLDLYHQSLDLYQQANDKSAMARVLQEMHEVVYFHLRHTARAVALLERSLALCREVGDLKGIAEALVSLGNITRDQGDYIQANAFYAQGLALNRQIGDRYAMTQVLGDMGYMYSQQGDYLRAIAVLQEGLTISREIGHRGYTGHLLWLLGRVKEMQGEYPAAQALLEEAIQIGQQSGGQQQVFNAITNLGIVAELQQNYATALTRYTEALELGRAMGNRWTAASSLLRMGRMQFHLKAYETARTLCWQSLSIWQEGRRSQRSIVECLLLLAQVALAQNETTMAARLFGAAEARREELEDAMSSDERTLYASYEQACQALLDESLVTQLWMEGRHFPPEALIAFATENR